MLRMPVASFDENPEGAVQKFTHFIYEQVQAKNIAKYPIQSRNGYGYLAEQRNYRSTVEEIRSRADEYGGNKQAKLETRSYRRNRAKISAPSG